MTRHCLVAAIAACVLAGPALSGQGPKPDSVRTRILGNWKLVSYTTFDQNGRTGVGNYDVGRVVYDASGEMSAHLMDSKRGNANPTTEAARSDAYRTYLAYFGPFTIDEQRGTVTHHVVGSSFPHWLGSEQVRYYQLSPDGRRLTLSTKAGDRVTATLQWDRVDR